MKRTFTANINGQVFHIDEDAYNLLQDYFGQLHTTFGGAEGAEIVADIESRVCEHFNERTGGGSAVITIADVTDVITTMGRPEDLGGDEGCTLEGGERAEQTPPPFAAQSGRNEPKKLFRNMQDRVLGGVVGGLGVYLGWNATVMRLLLIILALSTRVWPLVILYLVAWMIIPPAITPAQRLRMFGKPVTPDTMGRTMVDEVSYRAQDPSFWRTLFQVGGKIALVVLGIAGAVIASLGVIALLIEIAGLAVWLGHGSDTILHGFGIFEQAAPVLFCVQAMLWTLFAILMGSAAAWLAGNVVLGVRGASRATFVSGIVMAVVLFMAALIISGICSAVI